jgi:hypothetical protein
MFWEEIIWGWKKDLFRRQEHEGHGKQNGLAKKQKRQAAEPG